MRRLTRLMAGLCLTAGVWAPLAATAADQISAEHGVAAGRDIRDSSIALGFTAEQVQQLIQTSTQELKTTYQQQVGEVSQRLAVTQDAMISFFAILKRAQVPPDKLAETLAAIAQRHREMLDRLAALDPEDPTIKALIDQAQTAIKDGDYHRADLLLTQAEAADLAAAHQAQALAQQAQEAAVQRWLNAAATRAERGAISLTQLQYQEAAAHFVAATHIVPASHPTVRGEYLRRAADARQDYGAQQGHNDALRQAIETYHEALSVLTRERVPLDWAATQNNLGNALQTLGQREAGTTRLEQAVAAYGEALTEQTRERMPLDWAMTQNNLGNALWALGQREAGTARLEQAVAAYGEALTEQTRERVPLGWARTQNNLGTALATLGQREDSITRLRHAEAAIQSAYAVVKGAGYEQYDTDFEERLRSLRQLIAAHPHTGAWPDAMEPSR